MIRDFTDADLDAAAELLAERHARHREAEPLLPQVDTRSEVEALWLREGATGAVADGAFMLATRLDDTLWGTNAWVELAGHAARDPECVRDLYAFLAADWLRDERRAHYVWIPATDDELRDAWFRVGFGAQQALAVLDIPDVAFPEGVREATADDVDALVAIEPVLNRHQAASPVFSRVGPWPEDEVRKEVEQDLGDDSIGLLVAERDGRVVGHFAVVPVERSSAHSGLARPPGAALLAFAATLPEARGSGAGLALTAASFAWARARGYETMVTDWRVTNLLASRFWPKRGFRTTFLRLHRSIS
jgi:ribosomal protein S18 acetylase RimI-like enzyme